jgi:electron transport complex protein RnfC
VKLSPPDSKPIDTVIINGSECEPYLTADHRLMLECPDEILGGTAIIMQALGARQGYIAIEANKPDAYRLFRERVSSHDNIVPLLVQVKYPQGGEKQLIKTVLDREGPVGGLPIDVCVVVQNVVTASAVYGAVRFNRPLIDRVVTVTGPGVENPGNFRARVGTPIRELLEHAGACQAPAKVLLGGPMMGVAQASAETPVSKGTTGILVLTDRRTYESLACIRCGRCVDYCVMGLVPSELSIFGEEERFEEAEATGVMDCIECGCCDYVCPAKRPIVHYIKFLKAEINRRRAAQKSAE